MSDENWLRELAQVNREEQEDERNRLDERWDRLSRGELSPEEDAELRALAETSEEARMAYEAFRPLGPAVHANVVREIRKQGLVPPAKPLPFQRRIAGWSAFAALAAAASVVLLLRPPAPLPDYSQEVTRNVSALRGERPAGVLELAPGDGFTVTVRPATEVPRGSKLDAFCVLVRDGELRALDVTSESDPGGAFRMKGALGRDLPPGTWTLWAVVGRRGKLPDPGELIPLSPGARTRERSWVAIGQEVRVRPRTEPP